MEKGDVEFIRSKLLPWANVKSVIIAYSSSTKKWPDIWIQLGEVPVITVTKEWARQDVHERRKRLVHEFLHIKGMEHDEKIGYSTVPARDSYSMKVYKSLIKNPIKVRNGVEIYHIPQWPEVKGIAVGGCILRLKAGLDPKIKHQEPGHAHNYPDDICFGWICAKSVEKIGEVEGRIVTKPSEFIRHEYAHILAPGTYHGKRFREVRRAIGNPARDSYSMKVYKGLVANPTGRKRRLEAKWSKEWQGLDSDEKRRLALNIPGNHDVFGVIDYTGVILGGGYVTLPSGDNCYVVIQWHREGDQDKWDNWYWCDDISSADARRMAQQHRRDLRLDAKWEREERLGTR